jgi:formiminotetrahydrofolate cyclodeaminase
MNIPSMSLEQFLGDLASNKPTPGGGSAAAIIGAMGAALVSMVCNVTMGKKSHVESIPRLQEILAEAESLRGTLTAAVAEDIVAFDGLMAAYKLPKATDADKSTRSAAIQTALRAATEAPLDCARTCMKVIALSRRAAEASHVGVVSDAGVGVLAAQAALRSAALNVYINAPQLLDRTFADAAAAEIDALVATGTSDGDAVFALVRSKLG